jgi:hypothetical protein
MQCTFKPNHFIRHYVERTGPCDKISKKERQKKLILFIYKSLPNKHKSIVGHTRFLKQDKLYKYVTYHLDN